MLKQLNGFETILEELANRKNNIELEYNENFDKLMAFKDKCIAEWKKNSNEIIKRTNYYNLGGKSTDKKIRNQIGAFGAEGKDKVTNFGSRYEAEKEEGDEK